MIRTVCGDVEGLTGRVLTHEHLQIDLTSTKGAHVRLGHDELDSVISDVRHVASLGFGAIVDVTTPEAGRDVLALKHISQVSGVAVVCSTGYYWDPLTSIVADTHLDNLCGRLMSELTDSIEGSDIRAGLIKVGTHTGEINAAYGKIFQAAARASLLTGAPIVTHTSEPEQALWQIETLLKHGADPRHVLIGHLDRSDKKLVAQLADYGCFLGIDKIGYTWQRPDEERADLVKFMLDNGWQDKIVLSSDMARKGRLESQSGNSDSSYSTTWLRFAPLLRDRGISDSTIESILHENPNRLLSWSPPSDKHQPG